MTILAATIRAWLRNNKVVTVSTFAAAAGLATAWTLYALLGHRLIDAIYENRSVKFLNRIIAERDSAPVENYYQKADSLMWLTTAIVVILVLAIVVATNRQLLVNLSLCCISLFIFSLSVFSLLEMFPSAIPLLDLHRIGYFAYKYWYVPDPILVFKNRPRIPPKTVQFFGDKHSPLYAVPVKPVTYGPVSMDEDGFTNRSPLRAVDIVILGDSFIEFQLTDDDGFGKRLAKESGLAVRELGVAGYGPFQYVELLKRHGLKDPPKYALFCFFEGNDLGDIRQYLKWKAGGNYQRFTVISKPFLQRYFAALTSSADFLTDNVSIAMRLALNSMSSSPTHVHPDIVVLRLGTDEHRVRLFYRNDRRSTREITRSSEWKELTRLLGEFKTVAMANKIVPVVIYIPTATHIYAEYSTLDSGARWQKVRSQQIAAKANLEAAMIGLTKELGILLIDLSPVFSASAESGKLLYYPFDTHWNSDGRQLAAEWAAKVLRRLKSATSAL
jgi:hypothetical protein